MKTKSAYICRECGYQTAKWMGKCPSCGQWNTMDETVIADAKTTKQRAAASAVTSLSGSVAVPKRIGEVKIGFETRYSTGMKELDRVLGGGIVKGSLILVGGDPGIGKSTLLLQICQNTGTDKKILYVSG